MGEHKFKKERSSSYKSKRSRSVATTVIVLTAIVFIIGIDIMQRKSQQPLATFVEERTKGPENAPLKIVEFLDFQCPMCAKGSLVLKRYMLMYPESIRLTLKYFPVGELNSTMSAYYAECAAREDKFWEMHDLLIEEQSKWRTLLKVKPALNKLAAQAGLDTQALASCIERKDVKKVVAKEKALGESNFVKSTPTYFINGQMNVGSHALEKYLKDFFEKQTDQYM